MICSSCGTQNRAGRRFSSQCGATLSVACPECGAANEAGDRFCGDWGAVLTAIGRMHLRSLHTPRSPSVAWCRFCSPIWSALPLFPRAATRKRLGSC